MTNAAFRGIRYFLSRRSFSGGRFVALSGANNIRRSASLFRSRGASGRCEGGGKPVQLLRAPHLRVLQVTAMGATGMLRVWTYHAGHTHKLRSRSGRTSHFFTAVNNICPLPWARLPWARRSVSGYYGHRASLTGGRGH